MSGSRLAQGIQGPDWVRRGHYFPAPLPDADKRALKEFRRERPAETVTFSRGSLSEGSGNDSSKRLRYSTNLSGALPAPSSPGRE